jgi:hypothetical protein
MIRTTRTTLVLLALALPLALAGCGKKDDEAAAPAGSASAAGSAATDTAAATAAPAPKPVQAPAPAPNPAGASIDSCCRALDAIKKSGRDAMTKSKAETAAKVCHGMASKVKDGTTPRPQALTLLKASLGGVTIPGECN